VGFIDGDFGTGGAVGGRDDGAWGFSISANLWASPAWAGAGVGAWAAVLLEGGSEEVF
jgi:hypothetical protein